MAYPGFQRGGCLRSGPIRKVGGGGGEQSTSGSIYEKCGGGGQFASGPIRKVGGGGGGGGGAPVRFRSDMRKVGGGGGGGGGSPLQIRYTKSGGGGGGHSASGLIPLFGTQKISTCTSTYVLPRYASHARANERKIHAAKG